MRKIIRSFLQQIFLPELFHYCTEWYILLTPAVQLGPAAHLAGEALLDAGLEVVVWVCVTWVLRKVQLLNFSQSEAKKTLLGFVVFVDD